MQDELKLDFYLYRTKNMPAITRSFRSNEPSLSDVLREIHDSTIQLPDLQREWYWNECVSKNFTATRTYRLEAVYGKRQVLLMLYVSWEVYDSLVTETKSIFPFTDFDREEDYRRAWEVCSGRYPSEVSNEQLPISSEAEES